MDIDLSIIANREGPSECNWHGSYFGDTDRHAQTARWDLYSSTYERAINGISDVDSYGDEFVGKPFILYPDDERLRYVSIGQYHSSSVIIPFGMWFYFMWFDTRQILKDDSISNVSLSGWTRNYISSSMPNPITLEVYPFHFKEWDYSLWWTDDFLPWDILKYNWIHPDELTKMPLLASLTFDPSWSDSTWVQRSFVCEDIFQDYIVREGWTKVFIATDRYRQKIPPILNQWEIVELSTPVASGTPPKETILTVT